MRSVEAMASTGNENLDAALYHARAGRPVFPCSPSHKRPVIPKREGGNGFKDATTDEAQIRTWWTRYPTAVPGMPTGARVGVWVLDVDSKPGKVGDESLALLQRAYGALPDTVETITATGGRHLFFLHPRDGRLVPNAASQLADPGKAALVSAEGPFEVLASGRLRTPDLDVRGDGGYVILPGSVMEDDRRYEWEGSSDPDEGAKVARAPDWLLAMVVAQEAGTAAPASSAAPQDPIGEGGRNDFLYRLGCSLRAKGLGETAICAALLAENAERCDPPLTEEEVRASAHSAATKAPGLSPEYARRRSNQPPPPDEVDASGAAAGAPPDGPPDLRVVGGTEHDDRPEVFLRNGELHLAVDDAERHLIAGGAQIFQHGTRLVRVGQWESEDQPHMARPSGSGVLIDIGPEWLTDHLTRMIQWQRWDARKDGFKRVDCPTKVASTLLARTGSWRFPSLVGFCDSPTLDLDARVVSAHGYDPPSGLYLNRPPAMEPIGTMTRHDAERGGELLEEAVETFPFITEADRSACLAMMMTAILRRILPSAPIGGVSASTPGTGKSLLVDVISTIATGHSAAVVAIGQTQEEMEKRLDSVLLKGDQLCSFDNVDRPVKSDVLCQATTQPTKSVRVMGLSKIVEAPTNVALFMTGNNLTLVGDLVRRCLIVNLDAGCERPELRDIPRDAIGHVLERRSELIRAALMISKAYQEAGCPSVRAPPFGSFERWDRFVRRPLIWAGYADPLKPAEGMRDQDHDLLGMNDFVHAWRKHLPEPLTAAELAEEIRDRIPQMGEGWSPKHPELTDAAVQMMGDLKKWGARELGYRLRSIAGRLFGGLRVVRGEKCKRGVQWGVEDIRQGQG